MKRALTHLDLKYKSIWNHISVQQQETKTTKVANKVTKPQSRTINVDKNSNNSTTIQVRCRDNAGYNYINKLTKSNVGPRIKRLEKKKRIGESGGQKYSKHLGVRQKRKMKAKTFSTRKECFRTGKKYDQTRQKIIKNWRLTTTENGGTQK